MFENPLAILGVLTAAGAVGFFVLYAGARRLFRPVTPRRDREEDLANTRILFQTMRDLLEQQKSVASRLNQSLDSKVRHIQEVVEGATARMDEIEGRVAKLDGLLSAAEDGRDGSPGDDLDGAEPHEPQLSLFTPASVAEDALPTFRQGDEAPVTPDEEDAFPPPPEPTEEDIIASWEGFDFVEQEPVDSGGEADTPPEEDAEAPGEPEDPEAAREAFRALLDLETTGGADGASPEGAPRHAHETGGDGRAAHSGEAAAGAPTPLQARVYSYADAGMTPPQVAKELGIGKGEVMLILSLRKGREG